MYDDDYDDYVDEEEYSFVDPAFEEEMEDLHAFEEDCIYWGSFSDDCCPGDMDSLDVELEV